MHKAEMVLSSLEHKEKTLLKYLGDVVIENKDDQKNYEDVLIHARKAFKEAEAHRKELLAPFDTVVASINNLFKPYTQRLSVGIKEVNSALQAYHAKIVEENERIRQEIMTEQVLKQIASRKTGEVVEPIKTDAVPFTTPKTSHANVGTVTYCKSLVCTLVNPDLVPRDLCEPNMSKIRARANSGVTEIPGVLITEGFSTSTRSNAS